APLDSCFLCWPQAFKELSDLPPNHPLFREVENGCKGTTFSQTHKRFFNFFSKKFAEPPKRASANHKTSLNKH
ncbi:MAG: hypothetical protein J6W30_09035, partial [Bacteroidales bacterium]|nr:hypothetical protein [Bacteroidales bacterium]